MLSQIIAQHTNRMDIFGDYFDFLAMHSDSRDAQTQNENQNHSGTE